jgi:hypothetical protein
MRNAGFGLGRAVGAAVILSMALSAVGVRAASEEAGPPCSATVKDHCMEGAGSAGVAKMRHNHAARHHKHQLAMAKPAASAPAKPASATPATKPKAK